MSVTPAARRAQRNREGLYDVRAPFGMSQHGARAVDGSVLDVLTGGGHLVSSSWRDPVCDVGECFLPRFLRMVPLDSRRCRKHGRLEAPAEDPFPLTRHERRAIEFKEWGHIASRWRIPGRYRDVTLEHSTHTDALRAVREFGDCEDNEGRCLCLAGPTGVGKTHAAVALFRRDAVWACDSPVFFTFPRLVRLFVHAEKLLDLCGDELDPLTVCVEADLLMVDDVGAAYMKDGGVAEALFEELVVAREAEQRQTILTTNLRVDMFRQVLGDRIADRVLGNWGTWVSVVGASLRRQQAVRS